MKKYSKIFVTFFLFILLANCGFKVVKNLKELNFNITEIVTKGDERTNFKIKNTILSKSKNDSENLISLVLDSNKTKSIKEKNINNSITKYEIIIATKVSYKINNNEKNDFEKIKTGIFNVSDKYSQTINNEKNLVRLLTSELSAEIINELIRSSNEL
jgi:hypothetical protein|tara:strand:+ start:402 stop:875 length:474 start_codon:yes stop_codon:yes gene_type:complete